MTDDKAANKEIIAVKVRARIPQQYSSGLMVIYADPARVNLMGSFSLVVLGQELVSVPLSMNHEQMVGLIRTGTTKYETNNDLQNKLRHSLEYNITPEMIKSLMGFIEADDPGSSENLFKRTLERMLMITKIEVQLEYEYLSRRDFLGIKTDDEIEKATLSQKIQIVLPYANNARDAAEKIVRENTKDVALLKICFRKEGGVFGSALVIFSAMFRTANRFAVAAGTDEVFNSPAVESPLLDFFDDMVDLLAHEKNDPARIVKVESGLRKMDFAKLADAVANNKAEAVDGIVSHALTASLGEGVEARASFELMNSLKMEFLCKPSRLKLPADKGIPILEEDFKGLKVVNIDLLLAPTRGKSISTLKPGENVQVLLDASSPLAMKIIKSLNLISNNKVKPIGAAVHSIKYTPKSGYKIYVKIAEGVLGKAEEEHDIKIRMGDPVVEEVIKKSQTSLVIGAIAGAIVLAIILLIALLL